ncbi:efflux RND transporter permease subunit [Euhalothece natronophila Z-M001]|uniref:Efflux RND transporter permease subunit n=1 Tax=Euhalothece natronophila Z-M001 TaxID=522448 RepID=A0A5B8NNZ2_9CHRO|nr:efflux RND transporter permease subunit [Euhalothece natronophila]QDZ40301.1 efflux RND transporter permease subunit [Euhalothece natronophila Z-M001]
MFVNYFIKRPVFTTVASLMILLIGAISIPTLPVAQFPDISPKQVSVRATYTGADAETVEETVTNILEREITGVDGMRYMTSSSSNNGTSSITVTFDADRDQDIAAVDVQNRVSQAEPFLPQEVINSGIEVSKEEDNLLMGFGLFSENDEYDDLFLSNYADLYMVDALERIEGVGNVQIFGERQYAMRIWLDPNRLASRNLVAQDVVRALEEQNLEVGAGQIGQPPMPEDQEFQIGVRADTRLESVSEFEDVVVSRGDDGTLTKIKDVGRVELGAQDYSSILRFRGNTAVGLGINQVPGSNALEVAQAVRAEMEELAQDFPPGMVYDVGFDTTEFVEESIISVVQTLIQAVILVVLVIFVFLQDWRTTVIPAITVPLSLVGTFIFVNIFDFSINTLTLFGLTLATGMVVDDAIIVVEDIARKIQDDGLRPRQAAIVAMRELSGAVIATSLVLMAVFVPVAFFPGTTGALYRQFALTIAFAIGVSTFNALTITPTLSGLLLRQKMPSRGILAFAFGWFNNFLRWLERSYRGIIVFFTRIKTVIIAVFVALLVLTGWVYNQVPEAFLPDEDQGFFITIIQAPDGVALPYTSDVIEQIEDIYLDIPEVRSTFAIGGFSLGGGGTANSGAIFTSLQPWEERTHPAQSLEVILNRIRGQVMTMPEATVIPVNPPAIPGLGAFGGFEFQLQDRRGELEITEFTQSMQQLLGAANQHPDIAGAFSQFSADSNILELDVDRDRAQALQVDMSEIFSTLQTYLGSQYVNDFTLNRRNYRVYVQADEEFRRNPQQINEIYVRSNNNEMIPLGNLVSINSTTGAQTINHYNTFRSIEINGEAAPGSSSGEAIAAMEAVAEETLAPGLGFEWSGISLEEIEAAGQAPLIFGLGLAFVFLVLAAQYESYIDPIIIMLSVPLAVLGALTAQSLRGLENDVYTQVGLVMLIGLASKNSILIVEFANQLREEGVKITKAAIEAAQKRMRPIIMTAISTLSSIFPLVIATGAGAASRQSLGTAVFGGMFVATFLSLFIVPILYIVIKNLGELVFGPRYPEPTTAETATVDQGEEVTSSEQ